MNLKTLKEIEFEDFVCAGSIPPEGFNGVKAKIVHSNELKQEAIKRIKYYRERFIIMGGEDVIDLEGYHWTQGRMSGAISAWMLVFNITEEDLK